MVLSGMSRFLSVALGAVVLAGGLVPLAAAPALAATAAPPAESPLYGSFVAENPTLDWAPVTGAVAYRVQVSKLESFTTTLYAADTFATRATPPSDLPLGPLYWRVAGKDAAGVVGAYSEPVLFTKTAAAGPLLVAPGDGDALVYPDQAPVLAWNGVPAVNSYVVTLADNEGFTGAKEYPTSSTQLALTEPLTLSKPYFWKVRGVSATTGVTTADSLVRSFQMTWPTRPAPVAPVTGAFVDHVALQWSAVAGAKYYEVQVSPNGDFTNNLTALDGQTTRKVFGTRFSPTAALPAASYFWRVRAVDNGTTPHPGDYSDPVSFTIRPPSAPTLLRVDGVEGGTPVVVNPSFAWQGVPRAASYEIAVSSSPDFATAQTCTTMHTTFTSYAVSTSPTFTGAQPACGMSFSAGIAYHWRVRALDLHPSLATTVPGNWSATSKFFYREDVPAPVGPQDGTTTDTPVLTWTPVSDFGRYRVSVVPAAGGTAHTATTYATSYTPLGTSATAVPVKPGSYTWSVSTVAHNGSVGPTPLSFGTFTIEAPVTSDVMTTVQPAAGSTSVDMPVMQWTPLTGASHYRVYYAPEGTTSYTPLLPETQKLFLPAVTKHDGVLAPGTYNWFVRAYSATGAVVGEATGQSFSIASPSTPAPLGPTTCSTTEAAECEQADTPELTWAAAADATHYLVTLAADEGFTTKLREFTTQHRTLTPREALPDNQAGLSYYWYAQACKVTCGPADADQARLAAGKQSFRKRSLPVQQLTPAHESTQTDEIHFAWQDWFDTNKALPTSSGARAYHLEVATDLSFNNKVDDVTVDQPVHTVWAKSYPDGVYYWRVQAVDGAGQGLTWSATRSFTKTSSVPVPVTTAGFSSALPTLRWGGLPHVGGYAVEVYRGVDPSFPANNIVISGPGGATKFPAMTPTTALPAGDYSWRVRKLDASGNAGPWSAGTPTFTVSQSQPSLLLPEQGATAATNDMLFTWSAPMGPAAAAYRIETSTSESFATAPVEAQRTVMTAWSPVKYYADGQTYYWRVQVLDGTGNVLATSATRSFTKDALSPKVKSLPTSGTPVVGPVAVTFDEPVKGLSTASLKLRVAGATTDLRGVVAGNGTATATFTPTVPLVPGQRYTVLLSSAISDLAGNPLVSVSLPTRAETTVESGSPAVRNLWDTDSSSLASGKTYIASNRRGTTLLYSFSGTSIGVLGHTAPDGGTADYYVDGVKAATVSSYSSSPQWQKTLFSSTGLAAGKHELKVVVTGSRPTGSSGTWVNVDAVLLGTKVVQQGALKQAFSLVTNAGASGGSHIVAAHNAAGDNGGKPEYRFAVRGTTLRITGTRLPKGGQAQVYVDGALRGTIDGYASVQTNKAVLMSLTGLTDALHQVRVVVTGTKTSASKGYEVALDTVGTS